MAGSLHSFFFHIDKSDEDYSEAMRGFGARDEVRAIPASFTSDEEAARHHLQRILIRETASVMRGLAAASHSSAVTPLRYLGVQSQPRTGTRIATFVQTQESIPIFGTKIVAELGLDRNLVSANGDLAVVQEISRRPTLTVAAALQQISLLTKRSPAQLAKVSRPELNFYNGNKQKWHLVYFFRRVPAAPYDALEAFGSRDGHGLAPSPRSIEPRFDYLVDAHDGEIVFYYPSDPMLASAAARAVPIPAKCSGEGESQELLEFWTTSSTGASGAGAFRMIDPLRNIATYDLGFKDLATASLPSEPLISANGDWNDSNRAGVSAHVNLTRVFDFYNTVLLRRGIDDEGKQLTAVVNCVYGNSDPGREWRNAVWYNNRMWFGQDKGGDGPLRSYSRFLDITAHELTHGVTEHTCDLVYRDQSGALNESISDIFAVIINNWHSLGPNSDVGLWNWEIGAGLAENGGPLRDLSNPTGTGNPDHMDKYVRTASDSGGVHTNSNIHNKAAFNMLNAVDASDSNSAFTPEDVALLYYLSMTRLGRLADFGAMREMMVTVARSYYMASPQAAREKVAAIEKSYEQVGIRRT
jgi:bacillolysin